jgi:hypothetical protein
MPTGSLEGPFFYPNRMGRIILASMKKELGVDRLTEVLRVAGQTQLANTGALPANLDKRFPFETVSALQAATEQVYGARAGRNMNYRIGRGTFELGLKDFDPILGIADMPMRLMPFGMKFRVGLDVFARVFNQFSDGGEAVGDRHASPVDYRALPGVLAAPVRRAVLPTRGRAAGRVDLLGHGQPPLRGERDAVHRPGRPRLHL